MNLRIATLSAFFPTALLLAGAAHAAQGASTPAAGAPKVVHREPIQIQMKSSDGTSRNMVVIANDNDGDPHTLRLEANGGRVVVDGTPEPDRPWLGVLLDNEMRVTSGDEKESATSTSTMTVTSVAKASPAASAGLKAGDVITGVDGRALGDDGTTGLLSGRKPGETVRLQIRRDGKSMDVPVKLAGNPGHVEFENAEGAGAIGIAGDMLGGIEGLEALQSLKDLHELPCMPGQKGCNGQSFFFQVGGGPRLGVNVESMTDQLARFFGTEPGKGILVKDVVAGSPAANAGVQAGDVLIRVGDRDVTRPGDIPAALENLHQGDTVEVEVLRRGDAHSFTVTLGKDRKQGAFVAPDAQHLRELIQGAKEAARSAHGEALEAAGEGPMGALLIQRVIEEQRAAQAAEGSASQAVDEAREAIERATEAVAPASADVDSGAPSTQAPARREPRRQLGR